MGKYYCWVGRSVSARENVGISVRTGTWQHSTAQTSDATTHCCPVLSTVLVHSFPDDEADIGRGSNHPRPGPTPQATRGAPVRCNGYVMELPSYVLEFLYREAPRISCRILLTEGHNVLFYLALAPPCRSACSPGRSEATTTTTTTNIPPDPSAATDMNIGHRRWGVPFHFRRVIPSPVTLTGTFG